MLHPVAPAADLTPSLERIFVYGPPDSGKTSGWLQIADTLRKGGATPEAVRFYVLDTDYSVTRSLEEYPELARAKLVTHRQVADWRSAWLALVDFVVAARPTDWLIVDMINPLWRWCQDAYIERVYGKDAEDFYLAHRLAQKKGNPLDGFKDWTVINRSYGTKVADPLRTADCHVYVTAASKPVAADLDPKAVRDTYGVVGQRPTAQKDTEYLYHTVLLAKKRPGSAVATPAWTLTTLKERAGRVRLDATETTNFAMSYLMRVAGWRP